MTNKELLKIAQKHLGEGSAKFRKFAGLPSGAAWCNAFVDYIANEGKVNKLYFNGKKETYCPHSIKWCQVNLAQIPLYLAQPMDIIYFDWDRNNVPNHIGFVRGKKSTSSIYTIEGNTDGGRVAQKTRNGKYVQAVFRPHFAPDVKLKKVHLGDTDKFGFYSVYNLQLALGMKPTGILTKETVKYLQRKAGATADGAWGNATSKKVQKMVGAKVDGEFGSASVKALKKWINKTNFPAKKVDSVAKKTKTPTAPKKTLTKPEKAVKWAKEIAKGGKYTYKHWNNKDKKTKMCPICHPSLKGKYKGWNCIGFVSACLYHGAGLKNIECSCKGIGTDNFFTKVTLKSWQKRNGKDWVMITNGGTKGGGDIPASRLKAGDVVLCYDSKGKFHHVVLFTGNGRYIDCTNTSKKHIGERAYSNLCKRYHVTRAFRYVGD